MSSPAYTPPPFPSINLRDLRDAGSDAWTLHRLYDVWRFTLLWTLILYAAFHVGAAALAVATTAASAGSKRGKRRTVPQYLWAVPVAYVLVAGIEAVFAGSVVGLIIGAVYRAGNLTMSTAIPLVWGLINVLVLVISSFTMQSGL